MRTRARAQLSLRVACQLLAPVLLAHQALGFASRNHCPVGRYLPPAASGHCTDCAAGKYTFWSGSKYCNVCKQGTTSAAGASRCHATHPFSRNAHYARIRADNPCPAGSHAVQSAAKCAAAARALGLANTTVTLKPSDGRWSDPEGCWFTDMPKNCCGRRLPRYARLFYNPKAITRIRHNGRSDLWLFATKMCEKSGTSDTCTANGYDSFRPLHRTCLNGGTCWHGRCVCHSPYTGSMCQHGSSWPHKHGNASGSGVTSTTTNGKTSICTASSYDSRRHPLHHTCLNGGTCFNGRCECHRPYTGSMCQDGPGGSGH